MLASWKLRALCCVLIFPFSIFALEHHEIDLHYGIGASELSINNVPGFSLSFYPVNNFGISAGIEYAWRQKTSQNERSGENSYFSWEIENYKQTLSADILQIPILLKYRNDYWYVSAGMKIGAIQKTVAEVSWEGLNITMPAPLIEYEKNGSFKTRIHPSKMLAMLAFEYGINMKLSDNFKMLVGAFADYSFKKNIVREIAIVEKDSHDELKPSIKVNDNWKTWQPWSIGAQLKFAFAFSSEPVKKDTTLLEPQPPPPPPPPPPNAEEIIVVPEPEGVSDLPRFLLNREPNFVFRYPGERASLMDSIHLDLVSQIANLLKTRPNTQLHCVGYSETLLSESVAYETAFERALRIRYTLIQFYGISESRLFTYSQGSKNAGYRRTECFVF
jgi:hypothetical protein